MSGRIRSIKPEWLEDERLCFASVPARMLSVALMLLADDFGRGRAFPRWVQGQVFPGESDAKMAERYLKELSDLQFIILYQVDGQSYFAIRNWDKHQKVDHPGKPRVPAPLDNPPETLAKVPETLARDSEVLAPDQDQDQDQDQDLLTQNESLALEPVPPCQPKPKRQRSAPTEPHPVAVVHYFAEFERLRGSRPAFEKRDGQAIKRILARYKGDVERTKLVITHGLSAELGNPQTILTIANDPDKWLQPPPKPFKRGGGRQGPPQPNSGAYDFHDAPEGGF
jgi:hypothetical protein